MGYCFYADNRVEVRFWSCVCMLTVPGELSPCRSRDCELEAPPPSERLLLERKAGQPSPRVYTLHFMKHIYSLKQFVRCRAWVTNMFVCGFFAHCNAQTLIPKTLVSELRDFQAVSIHPSVTTKYLRA
jgi:hypothetical protein